MLKSHARPVGVIVVVWGFFGAWLGGSYAANDLDVGAGSSRAGNQTALTAALAAVPSALPDGSTWSGYYADQGTLPPDSQVRMLIGYPLRAQTQLADLLHKLYDPASPQFRAYLHAREFMATYGPDPADTTVVEDWLTSQGLTLSFTASNHLLIQVIGRAATFNRAFGITLRQYSATDSDSDVYYGTKTPPRAPSAVARRISALLLAMPVADESTAVTPDTIPVSTRPPSSGVAVDTILRAYQVNQVGGFTGQGVKIGIIAGGAVRMSDVQSFWRGQDIHRDNPIVRRVLTRPGRYNQEATLDVEWAGALAPDASIILYQGPDFTAASLVYLFNEAIGAGEVQVVTTSFSKHEANRAPALAMQQEAAAKMAAALGITVLAASGDSAAVDVPASCSYVTAVGGTNLLGTSEQAWSQSGSGSSVHITKPWYQESLVALRADSGRATADLALNAVHMVYYFGGHWHWDSGTSFAAPAFAGIMAVIDSARADRGRPWAGFLNSILYATPAVQRTFHDITRGGTSQHAAGSGWDYPTGWGTPDAAALARTLP